jgi:hypothetical protein
MGRREHKGSAWRAVNDTTLACIVHTLSLRQSITDISFQFTTCSKQQ